MKTLSILISTILGVHAHAIPYICVGAPQGMPGPRSGWFIWEGDDQPSQSLAESLCRHGGSLNGARRFFGNGFASGTSSGSFVNQQLQLCQLSYSENEGNYFVCGDRTSSLGQQGNLWNHENTWSVVRTLIEDSSRLPGIFQRRQAASLERTLEASARLATSRVKGLGQALDDLRKTASTYHQQVLPTAIRDGMPPLQKIGSQIPLWTEAVNRMLPSTPQSAALPIDRAVEESYQRLKQLNPAPASHAIAQSINQAVRLRDVTQITSQLSDLKEMLASNTDSFIVPSDRQDLERFYLSWMDSNGWVSDARLSENALPVKQRANQYIQSPKNTEIGRQVRYEINRGMLALEGSAKDASVLAGISLAFAADDAYQAGSLVDAKKLISYATRTIDFALGLIPGISSVNDLAQIAHGMVTGFDYTGARMSAGDYVFRSIGIVLGAVPGGGALVKLGSNIVSKATIAGATLIRNEKVGQRVAKVASETAGLAANIADGISHVTRDEVLRGVQHLESLIQKSGPEALKVFAEALKVGGVETEKGSSIVRSFMLDTLEYEVVQEARSVYRWHANSENAKQFGRYVSSNIFRDPVQAKNVLAIPDTNQMLYLDRFELQPGAVIFKGITQEVLPLPGGATQIFILQDPEKVLKLKERIYGP